MNNHEQTRKTWEIMKHHETSWQHTWNIMSIMTTWRTIISVSWAEIFDTQGLCKLWIHASWQRGIRTANLGARHKLRLHYLLHGRHSSVPSLIPAQCSFRMDRGLLFVRSRGQLVPMCILASTSKHLTTDISKTFLELGELGKALVSE